MTDTSSQLSAFAVYSKMRQTPDSAFSSTPAKKRHSSAGFLVQKKLRKRSASVGDVDSNEKVKANQKVVKLMRKKNLRTSAEGKAASMKPLLKRLSNGTAKPLVQKPATPNVSKRRSVSTKLKASPKAAASIRETNAKIKTKPPKSPTSKAEAKVAKKTISAPNSPTKKKGSKKAAAVAEKTKPEVNSDTEKSLVDDSEMQDDEEPSPLSSIDQGKKLFEWLISPLEVDTFFK